MKPASQASIARVYVYVDGFNFYHATKWTEAYPYGWCNWRLTAQNYCGQSRRVTQVKYFTSEILTNDPRKRQRQELHIAAMRTIARVVLGRFVPRQHECRKCGYVEHFTREKKIDTNIAIHMVLDAAANRYDEAFLVTADMDLLPAIEMVADERYFRTPRRVTVLIPPHAHTSSEFLAALDSLDSDRVRPIDMRLANIERFPPELASQLGFPFPKHWELGSAGPDVSPQDAGVKPRNRGTEHRPR